MWLHAFGNWVLSHVDGFGPGRHGNVYLGRGFVAKMFVCCLVACKAVADCECDFFCAGCGGGFFEKSGSFVLDYVSVAWGLV